MTDSIYMSTADEIVHLREKISELEEAHKEKDAFIDRLVEQKIDEDENEIGRLRRSLEDHKIYFRGFREGVYFSAHGILPQDGHVEEDDH